MNDDLVQKIWQCPNLPSLPAIAVQVLELASKDTADIAQIARVISRDPALSTKILRTVNSSFYGLRASVSTISHALVILGMQSVKTLALGFSLTMSLSKNKSKGFKHIDYWRRSIYAATAARTMAVKLKIPQQEEAFLAALLQDIGMLVLDLVLGAEYGETYQKAANHAELETLEQKTFRMTHAEVGAMLAEKWKLPPVLVAPIRHSHHPEAVTEPVQQQLAQIVQLSGCCADVFVDRAAARAIAKVRGLCASRFRVKDSECDEWMKEIAAKTKEVASLFEINIGSAADYEAILKKANEALVDLTLQTQIQATQLQEQNQVLKIQATTDALTGLNNRAAFDTFLIEHFNVAQQSGNPLTILLIDVDRFKTINDRFGHQIGDEVLSALGKILKSSGRPQDLAARYGGEELVLVLPCTPRAVGSAVAETIRRAVAAQPMSCGNQKIPVTVSIGVATIEPGSPLQEPAQLLKAADMATYAAKHGGRNCVKVFAAKSAA
jgi:two-component system, cell cycle response regulator